ncbi:MAG: bifunctional folylpolyglutamate synthase/dihydrofolate synthase, partial [Candidatus Acidiferrales bacterium]
QAVQRLEWLGHEGRSLKWDLNNVRAVLERLGHPERRFASVHIAGTNGKGSVAAMVESILRAAGHRTGLYTSPHLERINERIAVVSASVSDAEFAAAFNAVAGAIEPLLAENALPNHPSFFETLTAMAFWHFAQAGVEAAVLEVGMGGRLDATNVVTPKVAVITSIDFDHERYLGHSIQQIAAEKAGIIKPGVAIVSAAEHPLARTIVAARAATLGAPLVDADAEYWAEEVKASDFGMYEFTVKAADGFALPLKPSLRGFFQVRNALTAVAAARQLAARGWRISSEAIANGIAGAQWPGRLELVRREPLVFLDGAHNPAGARQVLRFWEEHLAGRRIHLIYGTVREKAVGEIAELLFPPAASVTLTEPSTPRAAGAEFLAPLARSLNPIVWVERSPARALELVAEDAAREDVIFVAGSLFLVGDCRRALVETSRATARAEA